MSTCIGIILACVTVVNHFVLNSALNTQLWLTSGFCFVLQATTEITVVGIDYCKI